MSLSCSSDALKTQRFFDESQITETDKVKVYIRAANRKSVKMELPEKLSPPQLQEIILKKLNISFENQILYLKGARINLIELVHLENSWIIHAINLAEVRLPQIFVNVKSLFVTPKGQISFKTGLSPKILVKQFIEESIVPEYQVNSQEILAVESGRILKKDLSFLEQNIQNGTTITLIHTKNDDCSKTTSHLPSKSEIKKLQKVDSINKDTLHLKSQIDSVSDKPTQKNDWKGLSPKKSVKGNLCQVHDKELSLQKNYSQRVFTRQDSVKTIDLQSSHKCSHAKNLTIQIGERECNCKKDKPVSEVKETKFVTMEDRKRLSKEIREENLQKLIRMKQKRQEESSLSPVKDSPSKEIKPLEKIRSMGELKMRPFTERKKVVKGSANPEMQKKKTSRFI